MLIYAGLLSVVLAFTTNWLALIPWRRAKDRHWTERARVCHPVRTAASSNLWMLPAVLTMTWLLLWPKDSPHWALMLIVTAIGAVLGTIPMDHEVFARVPLNKLLHQIVLGWLFRFLMWFVFLAAITLMPEEFNQLTVIIAVAVVALCIVWTRDGWIQVGKRVGLFLPPTERLQNIVRDTAARMNIPLNELWLIRAPWAQAFAMPGKRKLLFSERLLEILSDDEIAAVSAHELAHLSEARSDYFKRYVLWLTFLPWIFFKPLVHKFDLAGFVILLLSTVLVPSFYRRVSRKLEMRADDVAKSNEPDKGAYARALARLYEDNLLPAVNPKRKATHPHLYDRLLAAGVTPDFPRPAPAALMAWHGFLFAFLLGILATLLILRLTQF